MSTHTKGRLTFKAEGEANRYAMLDESGRWWMTVLQNGEMLADLQEANMRRLAACWNFCDGIPTEKLEGTDLAGYVSAQTMLTGMQVGNGSATMELEGGACGLLAASFADQFKRSGAVNFLELQMGHPDLGPFVVSMQRLQGKTPAQLKAEAERQRDELLAALKKLLPLVAGYEDEGPAGEGWMSDALSDAYYGASSLVDKIGGAA